MFGFSKKSGVVYGALIDVGSGSVGVAIVSSNPKKNLPTVIYSYREIMHRGGRKIDTQDKLRKMREALFSACIHLSDHGLKTLAKHNSHARIKRILVTCSSPWAHTVTKDIVYKNEKPFKIQDSLVKELVEAGQQQAKEEIDENQLVHELGLQIVEKATVNIHVNGYKIDDPLGKTAENISLSHITGLVPQDVLDAVSEVQDEILKGTKLSAHTTMLVTYCVLRDLFPRTEDFAIIDITGESTEIGIIENDTLIHSTHSLYGANTLLRSLAKNETDDLSEIAAQLVLASEQLSTKADKVAFETMMKSFTDSFIETVDKVTKKSVFPSTLVITALPELLGVFEKHIPSILDEHLQQKFTLLKINDYTLNLIASGENTDLFTTLSGRFFHKLHGCGEIETL